MESLKVVVKRGFETRGRATRKFAMPDMVTEKMHQLLKQGGVRVFVEPDGEKRKGYRYVMNQAIGDIDKGKLDTVHQIMGCKACELRATYGDGQLPTQADMYENPFSTNDEMVVIVHQCPAILGLFEMLQREQITSPIFAQKLLGCATCFRKDARFVKIKQS